MQMRQDSKKLGNFLGKWNGTLRQTAEHTGRAIYSQIQKVTSLEFNY